jgi:hypothetical protein
MYSPGHSQPQVVKNESTPGGFVPAPVKSPEKANTNEEVRTAEKAPETPIEKPVRRTVKPRARRATAQGDGQLLASNQTAVKETTIESWESPTAGLLSSPTDGFFKSVPQLNENANEMKSFLPGRSNDKEK